MKSINSFLDNSVVRTLLVLVALIGIGLVTRLPAWQFPQLYALHGVLAAPFFSALALWHFNRKGNVWQLFIAVLGLAAFLGVMNAVMGLSFLLLALCLLVAYGLVRKVDPGRRGFMCAVVFGALNYPCALVVGVALGSYAFSVASVPTILLLVVLAVALSLFGALLVAKVKR